MGCKHVQEPEYRGVGHHRPTKRADRAGPDLWLSWARSGHGGHHQTSAVPRPGSRSPLCRQCQCASWRVPAADRLASGGHSVSLGPGRTARDRPDCRGARGDRVHGDVEPYNDDLPYHENFELHRRRFGEIGELLARHSIKLGLTFQAAASSSGGPRCTLHSSGRNAVDSHQDGEQPARGPDP